MIDLAEADTRHLRLRLTTPAGSAERALDILGHDELDFAGNTVPLAQSRTFSRIRVGVGGVLRIAHTEPPLRITAYETIVVGADVAGSGPRARRGHHWLRGTRHARGRRRRGRRRRRPHRVRGRRRRRRALVQGGFSSSGGGTPGSSGSGPIHQVPGAGGGGGFGGFGYGRDGASGSAAAMPGFPSASFVPPLVRGAGGGGGGGGGGGRGDLQSTAGGGGGGGAGGGALELAAGEEIRIRGRVAANAGNGGDGAFPFAVGNPPSAPPFHAGCGGGGGAGSGGTIFLRGLRLLVGEVLAVGGMDGRAARFADAVITLPGTLTELQRLLSNPQSGLIQIDGSVTPGATVAPAAFLAPGPRLPARARHGQSASLGQRSVGGLAARAQLQRRAIPSRARAVYGHGAARAGLQRSRWRDRRGRRGTRRPLLHPHRIPSRARAPGPVPAGRRHRFRFRLRDLAADPDGRHGAHGEAHSHGYGHHAQRRDVVGRRRRSERSRRSAGHLPRAVLRPGRPGHRARKLGVRPDQVGNRDRDGHRRDHAHRPGYGRNTGRPCGVIPRTSASRSRSRSRPRPVLSPARISPSVRTPSSRPFSATPPACASPARRPWQAPSPSA